LNLLSQFESQSKAIAASPLAALILAPSLAKALAVASPPSTSYPTLRQIIQRVEKSPIWTAAVGALANGTSTTTTTTTITTTAVNITANLPSVIPTLDVDWASIGMFSALRQVFAVAISTAFPQVVGLPEGVVVVSKCGNPAMGHYQCNNAMGISKLLKGVAGYTGIYYMYLCMCRIYIYIYICKSEYQ